MNRFKVSVLLIISILMTSTLMIQIPGGEAQDSNGELKSVHVNMKTSDKFSPEIEHRNDTQAQTRRVNAQYTSAGPGKFFREYTDVGTWTSDGIKGNINLQGPVNFNLWVLELEDTADTCDFTFDFEYNGESVASKEITGIQLSADEVTEVTAQANFAEPISAMSGETFGVYIQYSGWNDIEVYFDNITYDSGAAVEMDSMVILGADSSSARFYDAWGINWDLHGKYFCSINSGGVINMGDDVTTISDGGAVEGDNGTTYETLKIKFNDIKEGDGSQVLVAIAYGPIENGTSDSWSIEAAKGGGGNGDDGISVAVIGGAVAVVVVLGAVLAYLFVFKKNAEEEYEDEEESEENEGEAESEEDEEGSEENEGEAESEEDEEEADEEAGKTEEEKAEES